MTRHPLRPARTATGPLLAAVVGLALAGCGSSTTPSSSATTGTSSAAATSSAGSGGTTTAAATGEITVFAAASLTESFTAIGKQFEAAHPGTTVTFSFGASSTLATQIGQGAPADVFASASKKTMEQVTSSVEASTTFAKNILTIVVPPTNPGKISGLADLAKPSEKVALCQETVPCGTVAKQILDAAKIAVTPVSREADVKAVLTKVRLGEVDAGLVYVTDAKAAGAAVSAIEIPNAAAAATSYPIAVVKNSANKATAQAFTDFVRSAAGTAVLTAAGFQAP